MTYGSLFTGVGGFDLGFDQSGLEGIWQVEKDEDCNRVLERHWPNTKRIKRVEDVNRTTLDRPDIICGGFPCQDLSVAGKRKGLAGERSGLWSEFHRIIAEFRPRFCVIENVPGLLSGCGCFECCALGRIYRVHEIARQRRFEATGETVEPCAKCVVIRDFLRAHSGRNMQIVVTGLVELGLNVATCVLDSQYRGVAQRRNRVFIVGSLGSGSCAEILFEPESVRGNSPPSRETRERVAYELAPSLAASGRGTSRAGESRGQDCVIADCLQERDSKGSDSNTKRGHLIPILEAGARTGNSTDDPRAGIGIGKDGDPMFSLGCGIDESGSSYTLDGAQGQGVQVGASVRRLTPKECERLQGFPDDWTRFDAQGKEISDSARYKMLGNAVTVSVAKWIGSRIVKFA